MSPSQMHSQLIVPRMPAASPTLPTWMGSLGRKGVRWKEVELRLKWLNICKLYRNV